MRRGRKVRVLVILVGAVIWTMGPWVPNVLCAIAGPQAAVAATTMPHCHHTGSAKPTQHRSGHDCCDNVTDSCCLRALSTSATMAPPLQLKAPNVSVVLVSYTHTTPWTPELLDIPVVRSGASRSSPLKLILRL